MPLFASFGFLTAIMIALALLAALVVLPSLLLIVATEPVQQTTDETLEELVEATQPAQLERERSRANERHRANLFSCQITIQPIPPDP